VSEPIRTVEDAVRFLDGLINRERFSDAERGRMRFSLAPIQGLLSALGNPERGLSIVHVAGSKGKGSTCLFGEAISRELEERTGVFLSPHLERWNERFRIDGKEVSDADLAHAVERVRPHVDTLRAGPPETSPSFFDAVCAVALLLFADAEVDRVWLEVGLGGRLDSTNAVDPAVTCITSIELEHTEVLGDTLTGIATEKAGILKSGVPAVVARLGPEAQKAVADCAVASGALLRTEGEAFEVGTGTAPSHALRYRDAEIEVDVELRGKGQALARCAGLAIACVRALDAHPAAEVQAAAERALQAAHLPARIEVVPGRPRVIVDSAHTEASALALAAALTELGAERAQLVLSVSSGKNVGAIIGPLLPFAARLWVTRADPDRSLSEEVLASAARELDADVDIRVEPDARQAIGDALDSARFGGGLVVAGSVYVAGVARGVLRERGRLVE
jgi:dihydrofolate synthase/folylpolyglutamate synthase